MRNTDLARFAELWWKIKGQEEALEAEKKRLAELGESLIQNMTAAGIKRATINGSTVHVNRMVRASAGGQMPALVDAMREAAAERPELASMINETINGNTLSAWVREHDPDNELSPEEIVALLPAPVRPAINVTEKWEIRCRKG